MFNLQVKENLQIARRYDSEITVKIPSQKEAIEHFLTDINAQESKSVGRRIIYRSNVRNVGTVLASQDWFFKIHNSAGDFAYILEDTLQFWKFERAPLREYTRDLQPKLTHRGYHLTVRFVKDFGSKADLHHLDILYK